jgi:IclR family acetate operon transcriptional repressor
MAKVLFSVGQARGTIEQRRAYRGPWHCSTFRIDFHSDENYCHAMIPAVRSVSQAFAILRHLADSAPQSLSELGRALELSPSSCLNLLRTLVDEGVIEREPGTKRYGLTREWAAADLFQAGSTRAVIDRMRPAMVQFAREHGTTVGLWKVVPGRRLRLIAHAESNERMRIQLADGQRQPLGGGAVGRALAAAQKVDDGELARRHAEVRWQKPMPLSRYIQDVRKAERDGFAVDDSVAFPGVCSIAVALPDPSPGTCLSASFFAGSITPVEIERVGRLMIEVCSSRH